MEYLANSQKLLLTYVIIPFVSVREIMAFSLRAKLLEDIILFASFIFAYVLGQRALKSYKEVIDEDGITLELEEDGGIILVTRPVAGVKNITFGTPE